MEANQKTPIERCADWWMKIFFEEQNNWDNGDPSAAGGMMHALGNSNKLHAASKATNDQKVLLREALIMTMIERQSRRYSLSVDYHPDFHQAFEISGVDSVICPCKTDSYIIGEDVFVKCGYGKPYTKLS